MDKATQKQLQDAQSRKANSLIELGKILHSEFRNNGVYNPDVEKICVNIVKIDAQIGRLVGAVINKNADICPSCKYQISAGASFCPNCGFGIQDFFSTGVKFCVSCGGNITIDCAWCPICGNKQG